jgi:hypothetical protein
MDCDQAKGLSHESEMSFDYSGGSPRIADNKTAAAFLYYQSQTASLTVRRAWEGGREGDGGGVLCQMPSAVSAVWLVIFYTFPNAVLFVLPRCSLKFLWSRWHSWCRYWCSQCPHWCSQCSYWCSQCPFYPWAGLKGQNVEWRKIIQPF